MKLINRSAVRALLLEQYSQWGHQKKRHNIASSVVNETREYLEDSAHRHIVAVAAQGFPGRKGGARGCSRDKVLANDQITNPSPQKP